MKVIIVGAGDVGFVSAQTISDVHDVLVIEEDEDVADTLKSRLNVSILREDGTNPRVLKYAIQNQKAEVVLSTLDSDPENLFVCKMAKSIDPSIRTIAMITNPDYYIESSPDWVDHIISPYLVTAEKMYKMCVQENLVEYEAIKEMGVCVSVFKVENNHPIVGKIVMHLPMPEGCTVFAMYRNNELHTDPETMEIHAGDRICVFGDEKSAAEFNHIVGVEDMAREFCILGGSIVGANLARMLADDDDKRYVKIIEKDLDVCKQLSRDLSGVVVINADYTDPDTLISENVFNMDATISTSGRDETNLLMCMTAKRQNARKVLARFFMREYEDIFRYTDIQTILGYDRIVSNEIIQYVIPDETAIAKMQSSDGLFFTHKVDEGSKIKGRFVGDLNLPYGLRIVAVKNETGLTYPKMDTVIEMGDSLIMFAYDIKKSEIVKVLGRGNVPEM